MSYRRLPVTLKLIEKRGSRFDTNSKLEGKMNSKFMNVISPDRFVFIIDFFEASIGEGYDRECHIG